MVGRKRKPIVAGHYQCADCKQWKPVKQFSPNVTNTSGLHSYCKPCSAIRSTVRRKARYEQEMREADLTQEDMFRKADQFLGREGEALQSEVSEKEEVAGSKLDA